MDNELNEEDLVLWQDVLDQVANGRVQGHRCPFCLKGEVTVTVGERLTKLECKSCHKYIEGQMQTD